MERRDVRRQAAGAFAGVGAFEEHVERLLRGRGLGDLAGDRLEAEGGDEVELRVIGIGPRRAYSGGGGAGPDRAGRTGPAAGQAERQECRQGGGQAHE